MDDTDIKMELHNTVNIWNKDDPYLNINTYTLTEMAHEVQDIFGCEVCIEWEFWTASLRSKLMLWVVKDRKHFSFRNLNEIKTWIIYQKDLQNKEVV